MRCQRLYAAGSIYLLVLLWTACKKNDHSATSAPAGSRTSVPAGDEAKADADMQMMIYLGLNGVISEGNLLPLSLALKGLITEDSLLSLGSTLLGIPPTLTCGATITPPTAFDAFTYYNYHGASCHGFSAEGSIGIIVDTLRMEYIIKINDLMLTRLSDGRKFELWTADALGYLNVIDQSHNYYPLNLGPGSPPFRQEVTGTVYAGDQTNQVTYTMQVSMIKEYSYSPDGLVLKTTGFQRNDSTGYNIVLSGSWNDMHYNAQPFEFRITDTLVAKQSCGWRMGSGVLKEHSSTFALPGSDIYTTFTFGLDKEGHPATMCMGEGDYYFRAFWQGQYGSSDTTSVMIAY
ncbi:MAG TPA: hypothetical protein VHD83_01775 [Puia sp.]|nr:hypothetical protein [Puia sp.]